MENGPLKIITGTTSDKLFFESFDKFSPLVGHFVEGLLEQNMTKKM
jgi:hypothetical protein